MTHRAALQDQRYQQDQPGRKPNQDEQIARQPNCIQAEAVKSVLHYHNLVIDRENFGNALQ